MTTPPDGEALMAALRLVHDPCSLAARAPVDIVDLGLVLDVGVDGAGAVSVRMCVTSASCTFGPILADAVREQLSGIAGVTAVDVVVDPAVVWDAGWISEAARAERALRLSLSVEATGLRPLQWQVR